MSEQSSESQGSAGSEESGDLIGDDQLPEDLVPSEDNPLAKGPKDDDEQDEGGSA
ncbi:hypothetical protein KLP28_06480 [Nocardioidaceae bacterium]|nr:hypothetical protein KLP28_06480 [Nocardioidaceae bacterium]